MDLTPLKTGFIGAGGFARHTLYPALHFAPIDLRAICELDEERAKNVLGKFGTGRWYTDYHQMWENEDIEAMIICTGPEARQSLVCEALEAGYHVFVPKPPAETLAAATEIAEVAHRRNKVMMVNFQRRFSLGVRHAIEIMQRESFGNVTQILGSFCSGNYRSRLSKSGETVECGAAKVYLLDFAIHYFDLIRYIGGEVKAISSFHNEIGGQGAFAVTLQFESGAVGTLQLNSHRLWKRNYDRVEITGQSEYIVLDGLWCIAHYTESQNHFTDNFSDQRNGELTGDGYSLTEFVSAIREEREPISSIHDCLGTMRLYEAVLRRQHGVVELNDM